LKLKTISVSKIGQKKQTTVNMHSPLEPLCLHGQQVLDIGTAGEDTLQVDPAALHVDPHVKQRVDAVQLVLP